MRNEFQTLQSQVMILPNGVTRLIQYNKKTKRAAWVVVRDGRQVQIPGEMFPQSGKVYFLPFHEEDRKWIANKFEAKRTNLGPAKSEAEYEARKTLWHNRRFDAIKALEEKYGTCFRYKGKIRKMSYTRQNEPYGFITLNNERVFGYVYEGKFVALK